MTLATLVGGAQAQAQQPAAALPKPVRVTPARPCHPGPFMSSRRTPGPISDAPTGHCRTWMPRALPQHAAMEDHLPDLLLWERAARLVMGTTAAAALMGSGLAFLLARLAGF